MRVFPLAVVVTVIAAVTLLPATSLAGGPYEPDETLSITSAPAPTTAAAVETQQDRDSYVLYRQGVRQIDVFAVLKTPCRASYGSVRLDLLDATDLRSPVNSIRLGHDPAHAPVPMTAGTMSYTTRVSHRYLLHVTRSGCDGIAYSLTVAPSGALGTTLPPTTACDSGRRAERRANIRLMRLRAARRGAYGAGRTQLGAKIRLQSQQVTRARADASGSCARPALPGYPWQ